MAFKLPELGYAYDSLEPHIDKKTMEIHYTKHHQKYLDKFNAAIEGTELEKHTPSSIFSEISKYSNEVRNNGGGYFNHALFWRFLTPHSDENFDEPLQEAIKRSFGSLKKLKEEFSRVAATQFGSGWAWLVKTDVNELLVTSTSNQDNPLMDINPVKGIPILCLDVWEHAYYLKYQNNRNEYIAAFWNIVNWDQVAEYYDNH